MAPALEGLRHHMSGKVRDIYEVDPDHLLDRKSVV